jgi:hypothetical protein
VGKRMEVSSAVLEIRATPFEQVVEAVVPRVAYNAIRENLVGVVQEIAATQPDALKIQLALDLGRIELEQECSKSSRLAGEQEQECAKGSRLAGELEQKRHALEQECSKSGRLAGEQERKRHALEQECSKSGRLAGELERKRHALEQECSKSGRLAGELERVRVKWEASSAAFAELERRMKKHFELERAAVLQCLRSQPP